MKKIGVLTAILMLLILIPNADADSNGTIQPSPSIFKDTMVEMTWQEIKKEAESGAVVLFPIAVVEEHGPQMDLSPDIVITCHGCRYLKQDLENLRIRTVIAPPYYWGINRSTGGFPGSFTVKPATMKAVLTDSVDCLKSWGFTKVFFVNLHGDPLHNSVLDSAAEEIRKSSGIMVYNLNTLKVKMSRPSFPPAREGKYYPDYHAGADETAQVWALYPEKVREAAALNLKPQSYFEPLGYVGDPASFKLEKTQIEILRIFADHAARVIDVFLKQSAN